MKNRLSLEKNLWSRLYDAGGGVGQIDTTFKKEMKSNTWIWATFPLTPQHIGQSQETILPQEMEIKSDLYLKVLIESVLKYVNIQKEKML